MAKPINFDESGDSEDLQALFDSIAGEQPPRTGAGGLRRQADASGDSDDLQALFDSASSPKWAAPRQGGRRAVIGADDASAQDLAFNRLGHMARQLHDTLRELGYDKVLEETAKQIPDARQRLTYIAQMTEQAACACSTRPTSPSRCRTICWRSRKRWRARWDKMFANQLSVDEFKALAADTRAFFARMRRPRSRPPTSS